MPPRRVRQRRTPDRRTKHALLYGGRNIRLFVMGLVVIALGYFLLSRPPVDGVMSLTLAPLLLVIGYCVLIPLALLSRNEENDSSTEDGNA